MSRYRNDRGTASIELVLIAPLLITILVFVIGLGRMAYSSQQVNAAAADAARAASLERNTSLSAAAAEHAARASLGNQGLSCRGLDVVANLSSYQPGGQVSVTVTCVADLSDVAMAGFPGTRTFTATSTVPIERWRAN
jgi:Flp pilus assembly protein TadG